MFILFGSKINVCSSSIVRQNGVHKGVHIVWKPDGGASKVSATATVDKHYNLMHLKYWIVDTFLIQFELTLMQPFANKKEIFTYIICENDVTEQFVMLFNFLNGFGTKSVQQ